jgi:hypothetical protein
MTIDEVKDLFISKYSTSWFSVVETFPDHLIFRSKSNDNAFYVTLEDLNDYLEFQKQASLYKKHAFENSICSSDYYEQPISFRNSVIFPRKSVIVFGDPESDQPYVEISKASSIYKNFFRFEEYPLTRFISQAKFLSTPSNGSTSNELLYSPITAKVMRLNELDHNQSAEKALELIENCLFNYTYVKGIPALLDEEWPKRGVRDEAFQYEEREKNNNLALPRAKINREIFRFYQRGMVVQDPVYQFLSFYQVLEYFFLSVSDEELYKKLSNVIHDPHFSSKPRHLDKIIQLTLTHKRQSDETEMLKLVLAKYLDEDEVIEYIKAYEIFLGEKRFTSKRRLFGEENEIKLNPGHAMANVAKRVKLIRNALVHSSDHHSRQEKFIPTRSAESEISKEVPLVKYLAEKIIIASSS